MNSELIAMLDYLERERSIKREVLVEAISSALLTASKKNFTSGTRELRIDIDPKSGSDSGAGQAHCRRARSEPS